jgi:hypothetical protein
VVNFRGIRRNVDSLGGVIVDSLFRRGSIDGLENAYVRATDGYPLQRFEIDWNARSVAGVLSGERVRAVDLEEGVARLRLREREVEVRRKRVRDGVVDDERLPEWKRSRAIERGTTRVTVTPYLAVAFHPDLDVVGPE